MLPEDTGGTWVEICLPAAKDLRCLDAPVPSGQAAPGSQVCCKVRWDPNCERDRGVGSPA